MPEPKMRDFAGKDLADVALELGDPNLALEIVRGFARLQRRADTFAAASRGMAAYLRGRRRGSSRAGAGSKHIPQIVEGIERLIPGCGSAYELQKKMTNPDVCAAAGINPWPNKEAAKQFLRRHKSLFTALPKKG